MLVTWHPTRWWDWYIPDNEKKGIEPIFTDKNQYKIWWEVIKCFQCMLAVYDFDRSKHFGTKNYV